MANGRELIIKVTDGASAFDTVCVTEARSLTINNNIIDISKPDCANPANKLVYSGKYGMQRVSFQGDGAFVNNAAKKRVMGNGVDQVTEAYQVVVPGWGMFQGDAQLETVGFNGAKEGELQASFTATFTGAITFTAET
ncbi:MAG: phage tail tube protein [Pseudomonadota bacterium]